jgi:hypothetical protein
MRQGKNFVALLRDVDKCRLCYERAVAEFFNFSNLFK